MENQHVEEQMSPEELAQRKEEMKSFYDESAPYLEAQAKYERLLTEIEESRFKRASFQYQYAMMMAQQPEDPNAENETPTDEAPKGRKLKKS
jgi:hypothetical protein